MAEILVDKVGTGFQVRIRTGKLPDDVQSFPTYEEAAAYAETVHRSSPGSKLSDTAKNAPERRR